MEVNVIKAIVPATPEEANYEGERLKVLDNHFQEMYDKKEIIRDFIKSMNEKGTTFVLTTHDLQDVEELAKNIIIINQGEKVFDGSIGDLRHKLGSKKIVELNFTKRGNSTLQCNEYLKNIEGTKVTSDQDGQQLMIEVDTDIIPMNKFISLVSDKFEFSDISIKELPMERIITHIYTNTGIK